VVLETAAEGYWRIASAMSDTILKNKILDLVSGSLELGILRPMEAVKFYLENRQSLTKKLLLKHEICLFLHRSSIKGSSPPAGKHIKSSSFLLKFAFSDLQRTSHSQAILLIFRYSPVP
jgi:hypothetical protein